MSQGSWSPIVQMEQMFLHLNPKPGTEDKGVVLGVVIKIKQTPEAKHSGAKTVH